MKILKEESIKNVYVREGIGVWPWSCMAAFPKENRISLSFLLLFHSLLQPSLPVPKKMVGAWSHALFFFPSLLHGE